MGKKTCKGREEHPQKKNIQPDLDQLQNNIQTKSLTLQCLEETPATNYRTQIWKKPLQGCGAPTIILMEAFKMPLWLFVWWWERV